MSVIPLHAAEPGQPYVIAVDPPPGIVSRFTQITFTFNEPVTDVVHNDLRVNDNGAFNEPSVNNNVVTYTFPPPPYGQVEIELNGIKDFDSPAKTMAATNWVYTFLDAHAPVVTNVFPAPGETLRRLGQIEVAFSEPVKGIEAADLLVNGQPATNLSIRPAGLCLFQFAPPPPGLVQARWVSSPAITDYAASPNSFIATGAWDYQLDPTLDYGDLVISEFCAANRSVLVDEEGFAADWLEILNRGAGAVDLSGWSLSDEASDPGKWAFPPRVLAPGERLVLFASSKDIKSPDGTNRMHLNFSLSAGGEFLGLFTPESPRVLQSGFDPGYPGQRNDYSYGLDSADQWRYFATPTPGAPNGESGLTNSARPVHFSVERGFFTQPFDVILTSPTAGAIIRYTTDGTEPTAIRGATYSGPLRISGTTVLRAAAFRENLAPSAIRTHTYLFNASAAIRSLPVLSIVTDTANLTGPLGITGISVDNYPFGVWAPLSPADYNNNLKHGRAWERPVSAEFIRPDDNRGFQIDCGIRVNGSEYMRRRYKTNSKFSYRLYFRSEYGEAKLRYPLFPTASVQEFDVIVLRAGHNDQTNPFIKDELVRRLHRDMGQAAAQGTFVNLFINGEYKGYYNPCERVNDGSFEAWEGGAEWDQVSILSELKSGDLAAWHELRNILISGQSASDPSVYQDLASRLDVENFVDYLLVSIYGAESDWPHNNWHAARPRVPGGRYQFYSWDSESAFGNNTGLDVFAMNRSGMQGPSEIAGFYRSLYASPEFRLLFADRIQKHFFNGGALTDENITGRFHEMRSELAGVIPSMNLGIINTWVPNRRVPLFSQFNAHGLYASNAPVLNQHGGRVPRHFALTLTAPQGGTIYYTLDGSDPRVAFTGAISPSAVAYAGPLTLDTGTAVKARAVSGRSWSALTEAEFQVASLGVPIRITELHYNPVGGSACEFLELQNVGPAALDLNGFSFDGISYVFPLGSALAPGAVLVLANNDDPAVFTACHPGVAVFGWFGGNLANSGERIALKDRDGDIVASVEYDDQGEWPGAADGSGPSLEIIDPFGDSDDPANWRASAAADGTPGTVTPPPSVPMVRLNEVMADNRSTVEHGNAFPDWAELHNAGSVDADLSGWSLTDDANPVKFVFPAGTVLAAGGYLVIWCDTNNAAPGLHTSFGLSRNGDRLYLYDSAGVRVDGVSFGPQVPDCPIGRIGNDWQLTVPTTNAPNVAASLGSASSLTINEWLANPPPGQADWLELHNASALPIALRGLYVGNSSAMHQIASLSFIAPGGFVQLFADEGVGPDHLDWKLPAGGGAIVLYDAYASEVDQVNYPQQREGVARGRLPDGSALFADFVGTASPGASNYVNTYTGPVFSEVLARNRRAVTNQGRTADFVEIHNSSPSSFDLSGLSLSVNEPTTGQWRFPPGTIMAPQSYLVVWCDDGRPASTAAGDFNTGLALDGESGGIYLFSVASQLLHAVEYGPQVTDKSIGLAGPEWRLLERPTPSTANAAPHQLGTNTTLRLNEWMAQPARGPDWFELFNADSLPVELSGLHLTDDPSVVGLTKFRIPPLSFIGARDWARFVADDQPWQGRHHVNFSLSAEGENLFLVHTNGSAMNVLDNVSFERQKPGISQGRLPDGSATITNFPGSASPAEPNSLLLHEVVINEILAQAQSPFENALELHNPTTAAVDISGWFLSDEQDDFQKFQLPAHTVIPPGGFVVISESQFSAANPLGFTLNGWRGGELWLSATDTNGNPTGHRTGARFGPAAPNVSLGRHVTPTAVEYVPMSVWTPGSANAMPLIGPVIVSELMYHPPEGTNTATDIEYVELLNITAAPVPLYDPAHPTNTWRLRGGIDFQFPADVTLAPGEHLLVVNFDPADTVALWTFRNRYGLAPDVQIYGPFSGSLNNAGDRVELSQPQATSPDTVVLVPWDTIDYGDSAPWPSAADGDGASLQRRNATAFGNDPLNWLAAAPTPGTGNASSALPVIAASPLSQSARERSSFAFSVEAIGGPPLSYQWRFNGVNVPNATNTALFFDYLLLEDAGNYDVVVSTPSGSAISAPAILHVVSPPEIVSAPVDAVGRLGYSATFSVATRGLPPLAYQWRKDGMVLAGETNATLLLTNVQFPDEGVYEVTITNRDGMVTAAAFLQVVIPPAVIQQPLAQTVAPGEQVTLSVGISGHPAPFEYQWRLLFTPMATNVSDRLCDYFTFTAPNYPTQQNYRVVIRNAANPYGIGSAFATVTVSPDSDGDGLPNAWETAHGLDANSAADRNLDADNDGLNNWEEYRAGTNPTNRASLLSLGIGYDANGTVLSFDAVPSKTYSVQYCDDLAVTQWQVLMPVLARTSNRVERVLDTAPSSNRFYRVVTPAQP